MNETEAWAAVFFRWTQFTRNSIVRTSLAVSNGLNWATSVHQQEEDLAGIPGGSRLLHFLSPEITFALPQAPNWELLLRFHHRSGDGGFLLGKAEILNGVSGGRTLVPRDGATGSDGCGCVATLPAPPAIDELKLPSQPKFRHPAMGPPTWGPWTHQAST